MIKNNFNELMAQKKLKITRVSNDTGISRPTLTSLTRGESKGIQYDTLNTLCNYFNITPCEFFDYIPYEFTIKIIDTDNKAIKDFKYNEKNLNIKEYELFINVLNTKGIIVKTYSLNCILAITKILIPTIINEELTLSDLGEERYIGDFIIKNDTEDEETFLNFLKDNFTTQWSYSILEFIDNSIYKYGNEAFYEFGITNVLKDLI
jgi:hypothetical protein